MAASRFAAHVLVKPLFACLHCFVRKVKKMKTALPIQKFCCAPSSAVSVAGGWWVAAVGFVVVLQRHRSYGSRACPGGLVSGWTFQNGAQAKT